MRILLDERRPGLSIKVLRYHVAQFSVAVHAFKILALLQRRDWYESQLNLECFLGTFREETEDILADTAGDDSLGLVSRSIRRRRGRGEDP